MHPVTKRFAQPDEVLSFAKGTFEIVHVGSMTLGRATYEPGWHWARDVGASLGAELCAVEHVGLVLEGSAMVRMRDGSEIPLEAGDLFHVPPDHDSWVVGDERYVSLHLMGADAYAKISEAS